jgi:hypothetical protein
MRCPSPGRTPGELREAVEGAIVALGTAFLRHEANGKLLVALTDGALDAQTYLRMLLRLVYRMIFLLLAGGQLADERRGGPEGDLWQALRRAVGQIGILGDLELSNEDLARAIGKLASFRSVGVEELGSVYERLLERHSEIHRENRTFRLDTAAGHERKTTGSYYTPRPLVDCLLDLALGPVLDEAANKGEAAILELKVCDPACGAGHFLVAAARRIAMRLAEVRSGGEEPSPPEVSRALGDVIGRCIYGVDLNPMAVELCRVSLWMEALAPGEPSGFLEAHIRQGNALLGATGALMAEGIPDEAFEPIEGDDQAVAKALKKRNRDARKGQDREPLAAGNECEDAWFLADAWCAAFVWPKQKGPLEEGALTEDLWRRMKKDPASTPEVTRTEVQRLAQEYSFFHWHLAFPQVFSAGGFDVVLGNPPWERIKLQEQEFFSARSRAIANATHAAARKKLIAALPETAPGLWSAWGAACRKAEGQSHFVRQSGRYPLSGKGDVNTYALFAEHNRALLGPRGRAGFIVPTGIATDDTTKEYFGALLGGAELAGFFGFENEELVFPDVHHAFKFALLCVDRSGSSARADLVFFARDVSALADPLRRVSLSPSDFVLVNPNTRTCPTFRSRRDADLNLALYRRAGVLLREDDPEGNPWGLRFSAMFHMSNDSALFSTAAELEARGFRRQGNQYALGVRRMLPLVEAKMVQHFDHRFGTYAGQTEAQANQGKLPELDDAAHADPHLSTSPKYWVEEAEAQARLGERWRRGWLLGWRDICRSTDQRTVIASLIPRAGTGDTFLLAMPSVDPRLVACLYANLCSFVLDYAARQKVGGTHLKYHVFKQLPVLAPSAYAAPAPWNPDRSICDWLVPRVLELAFTAWDLEPFARDCGHDGAPFRWDRERRARLRAELDAAFFHLYGLPRDDAACILDTFPVVRKNDEKTHGDYRTRRVVLEAYDALADAIAARP